MTSAFVRAQFGKFTYLTMSKKLVALRSILRPIHAFMILTIEHNNSPIEWQIMLVSHIKLSFQAN